MVAFGRRPSSRLDCVAVAFLAAIAGMVVLSELLRQMPDDGTGSPLQPSSLASLRFLQLVELDSGCGDCISNPFRSSGQFAGSGDCRCKKQKKQKLDWRWDPSAAPTSRLLGGSGRMINSKIHFTPSAQRNQPFLRRTPGIDYSKTENSTHYLWDTPDPAPYPQEAPEPSLSLPPMFSDDYSHLDFRSGFIPQQPEYTTEPPLSYSDWVQPPIA
ncbi:uncharacterized protein [Physcomitrium patens]|uniref:Uncharacterized protein n=1 Tax=Physcomitrium patens TaxID=3218 RepID=A0A2K1JPC7_PHYPA|nr:uncharacterized protein LOC112289993 [Physcomitrium patens]PNR43400.1 hypothetical protein PHYPA_015780 [Physcomitrium patens]|eukprot:XP_024391590.1 uncharacterized protein LOC112289993 [Physcomitrella patens]